MDFSLSCWYLNARRIRELTGDAHVPSPAAISALNGHSAYLQSLAVSRRDIISWLKINKPPTFEMLHRESSLIPGAFFTIHKNFYFKGLGGICRSQSKMATGYSKFKNLGSLKRLEFDFSPEHLTSNSSWVELSGHRRKFVLAHISDVKSTVVRCTPYVIADLTGISKEIFDSDTMIIGRYMEQFPPCIDQFSKISEQNFGRRKSQLEALKSIPEADIKRAFAEIIKEPTIPKDWGGEQSDMFTTQVSVQGKQLSAAFAFKGPAKFKPMTMADLGKNGDQINRLYMEPADILFLQHCHEITPQVRTMMRAFANQAGNLRQYCIIDGYETYRILRTYNKLGLK